MVVVFSMAMAVVNIIHVIVVLHGFVRAILPSVCVLGHGVLCLDFFSHDVPLSSSQPVGLPEYDSRLWVMVSRMTRETWSSANA